MIPLPKDRPLILGILNVTPDSFSDGGQFSSDQQAIDAALRMVDQGADAIDVGGESTRPNAAEVPLREELRRTVGVVRTLSERGIKISIDTRKPTVAKECLAAGALMVNDVSGLRNPEMVAVCSESDCGVCIMHMLGEPGSMQTNPRYYDVVMEVREYLEKQAAAAIEAGIKKEKIWIDPGIGFGKTVEHNFELLAELKAFVQTGFPVLVGVSRKSFLGRTVGTFENPAPVDQRGAATTAAETIAILNGARIIRTHDVPAAVSVSKVVGALRRESK